MTNFYDGIRALHIFPWDPERSTSILKRRDAADSSCSSEKEEKKKKKKKEKQKSFKNQVVAQTRVGVGTTKFLFANLIHV